MYFRTNLLIRSKAIRLKMRMRVVIKGLSDRSKIARITAAIIVVLVFPAGCEKSPSISAINQARHDAAMDISKNTEYQPIREWLISQDFAKWPSTSNDALKLQAELDIALQTCRKLKHSAFADPSIVILPASATYREYDREIPRELAEHGMATIAGTLTMPSKKPDEPYKITLLGTTMADAVHRIGKGLVVASTGKISQPKALYTNTSIQGICASMIVESPTDDSFLFSTNLPRDRIILYTPSPMSRDFFMLFPTGPGSIFGIRGTVSDLFPGITIRSEDNSPIWFALTKEMGLIYLIGKGRVIYTSTKRSDTVLGNS